MNQVTIEELEQLKDRKIVILDVRKEEDYNRGTFEGAINLPIEAFTVEAYQTLLEKEGLAADLPVYLLCHTGEKSRDVVEQLESAGYEAYNINGGYRSLLRLQLSRYLSQEDEAKEKTHDIERSIIKKFRKSVWV